MLEGPEMARMLTLANAGPCPLWVISGRDTLREARQLYLRKRTRRRTLGADEGGQQRTSAPEIDNVG